MTASITTKTGDQGMTSLYSGETVPKSDLRMSVCGDIDELNSFLGLAKAAQRNQELLDLLTELQQTLFVVGSIVATVEDQRGSIPFLETSHLERLDSLCAHYESVIQMPTDFILPGGTEAGARLDVCRSVARRAERGLSALIEHGYIERDLPSVWMNRVSDLLWLLARASEGDHITPRRPSA